MKLFTKKSAVIFCAVLLLSLFIGCSDDDTASNPPAAAVADPVISPAGGVFSKPVDITITCTNDGAQIYYTTNGMDPGMEFNNPILYSGGFTLSNSAVIKAIAKLTNRDNSATVSAEFTLNYTPAGQFTWSSSGGKVTITGYSGNAEQVFIPAEISGMPVTALSNDLFFNKNQVKSVTVPDSVTTLHDGVFRVCSSLQHVKLSTNIVSFGESTFSACISLTNIALPASLTNLGNNTFNQCDKLENITVDPANSHYQSSDGIFYNKGATVLIRVPQAKQLANYTVPGTVTAITAYAADECTGLQQVTIPGNVVTIGEGAFRSCPALNSLTLEENIKSIGNYAFYNSPGLNSVTVPASVTNIGITAFAYSSNMTAINIAAGNTVYRDIDGVLFSADANLLIQYPSGKVSLQYTVPSGTTNLGDSSFMAVNLTNVILPSTLTKISKNTFYYSKALTAVSLPASVDTIGDTAFYLCSALTRVDVHATTPPALGNNVFLSTADGLEIHVPTGELTPYQTAWADYSTRITADL